MPALPLSDRTLAHHARTVATPRYDRHALAPGVVHLSVGYFHRAHQAVYFDALARRGHTDWGVTGVGLRRPNMRDALVPQDGLYTVVERDAGGDRPRIVGAMTRYLFAPDGPSRVVAALADERTRLVTMTVTGAGYTVDAGATFDDDDDEVTQDVAGAAGQPRSLSPLELVVDALDARRRAGLAPFTVLSCDNIARNGETTRRAIVDSAELRDPHLARWIAYNVAFPSGMVDRITPETADADRDRLAREFGVLDRWPVMTEPFSDWVIEDQFANGRPPLDDVGVRFVSDVQPYALTKTRLLNASHLLVGSLARVAGFATMADAMSSRPFRAYTSSLIENELAPAVPDSDIDLDAYRRSVVQRMGNPAMRDRVARLCRGASLKFPRHVLPSIEAAREEGRPHPLLTLGVAGLFRQLAGVDDLGGRFDLDDPIARRLGLLARAGDPRLLLSETPMFGTLGRDEGFVRELENALDALDRDGVRATVARAVAAERLVAA